MERRTFLRAVGLSSIAGLAGCTGGPTESGSTTTTTNGSGTSVAMVYATGGLGDGSFNDQAQTGLEQAEGEFDIASEHSQPGRTSEFKQHQSQYAQQGDWDLISCIGSLQHDALAEVAPEYPDQKFMVVDTKVDADNVESYQFREEQGSFQVGYLAGLVTTEGLSTANAESTDQKKVGFVGGSKIPLIEKFEAGYRAGVKHVDSSITVSSKYAGSFNDIAKGKEAALSQYNSGADVVYHAAGNTGTGVFEAATEAGRFAIGVDKDQSKTAPKYADHILASMVKHVDIAVYDGISNVVNDEFEGGSATTLGLEKDGLETVYGDTLGSEIPDSFKSELESTKSKLTAGDISVPTDPSNV